MSPPRVPKSQPEQPERLPVKLDPVSNGEFIPTPASPETRAAQRHAHHLVDEAAQRTGRTRREVLRSVCGAAATLTAMNLAYGCTRRGAGGHFEVPAGAVEDEALAQAALGGDEFIFDVQTHHVTPERDWFARNRQLDFLPYTAEGWCAAKDLSCYDRDRFVKEVFLDSDTDMAVLSALAELPENNPLTIEEAARTRDAVEALGRGERLQLHGIVLPNGMPLPAQLEGMQHLKERFRIMAWKLYPVWGPQGRGYLLDDPAVSLPVIEQGRRLGVKRFAVHKGLPLPGMDPRFTRCDDVGRVARLFPDVQFLIYHSGYEGNRVEGPYDAARAEAGVDALVKSLADSGIGPGQNVYAELGATWKLLMTKPDQAAHVLGKLLRAVGEDNLLWGTDSIWFGSPQDQLQAFRAFQISEELQERHGYPALTPALKRKVLGLNGARVYGVDPEQLARTFERDALGRAKRAYAQAPSPSHLSYGPTTRAELFDHLRRGGGRP
jgi:uncharacterized protein